MKRILTWTVVVVGILLLAVLALPLFIDANQFRPALEARLSAALERPVTIGDLSLALFSGGVAVREVVVAGDPGSLQPLLRAKSITAGVDMRELILSQRLIVRSVTIVEPEIVLVDTPERAARSAPPAAPSVAAAPAPSDPEPASAKPLNLSIQQIRISGGRISLNPTAGAKPIQLQNVSLDLKNFAPSSSFPFTLEADAAGGGSIKIEGQVGPIQPKALAETPFDAKLKIQDLDLAASGFFAPESGIAGLLTLDGNAAADGRTIDTSGHATLGKLRLAKTGKPAERPAEVDFSIAHENSSRRGKMQDGKLRLGSAAAAVSGTYDISGREPSVNLKLTGTNMPLTELAAFLPALDIQLPAESNIESGTANIDITAQGPVSALTTTAVIRAEKTRLAKFNLGEKLKTLAQVVGLQPNPATEIELLAADIHSTSEGTAVNGLKMVVPGLGELAGQGTISPQHALDFRLVATLPTTGSVKEVFGQNIPVRIQGTSSNPSFSADLKTVASQKIQQAIRNPEGAAKTVNRIMDMFKRAPKQDAKTEVK